MAFGIFEIFTTKHKTFLNLFFNFCALRGASRRAGPTEPPSRGPRPAAKIEKNVSNERKTIEKQILRSYDLGRRVKLRAIFFEVRLKLRKRAVSTADDTDSRSLFHKACQQ